MNVVLNDYFIWLEINKIQNTFARTKAKLYEKTGIFHDIQADTDKEVFFKNIQSTS